MVKRLFSAIFALLLLALATSLHAEDGGLRAEADRTQLHEGEVITLTVVGTLKIDINLSNLFSLDLSQLPAPDIEKVEPAFEVLARNQRYSVTTVNNEMQGQVTWTYQLAPRQTGQLTIPSLTFKDATSEPITVEVLEGNPPNQATAARDSFIELAADKADVYVQEQLVLTVRLFFRGNLIRGELSEPSHPHLTVESLGKQREFARYRDGVQYRVVERRYALFPQRAGNLSLPPVRFEGQARDADGQLVFLRDSEQLFDILVKEVPESFTGDVWLPASELTLTESGLPPELRAQTGDNLARELTLKAKGLPSEALPPLPELNPEGVRSYPDQPQRSTEVTPEGLAATLSQTRALVPIAPGTQTLPAITIPWWDTDTDTQQSATIPARKLQVTGSAATSPPTVATETAAIDATAADSGAASVDGPRSGSDGWRWLSLVLGLLWLATLAAWWWHRRTHRSGHRDEVNAPDHNEKALFDQLTQAARQGTPGTSMLLIWWVNQRFPGSQCQTAAEALAICDHPALSTEFQHLQERLFATAAVTEAWDGLALARALGEVRSRQKTAPAAATGLAPLYPDNLSG